MSVAGAVANKTEAFDLLRKYDVPGPRYTSYPTILHWDNTPTVEEWLQSVSDSIDLTERHADTPELRDELRQCLKDD